MKRNIRITETNEIASMFNTSVVYASDALPEWFAPLRSIVEDEGFDTMTIAIREVHYLVSVEDGTHREPEPLSSTSATTIESRELHAIETAIQLLAAQIINLRTELLVVKALCAAKEEE